MSAYLNFLYHARASRGSSLGLCVWLAFGWIVPAALPAADADAPLCRPIEELLPARPPKLVEKGEEGKIFLAADKGSYQALGAPEQFLSAFSGNVLVQRDEQILRAEQVEYDRERGEFSAGGEVILWDRDYIIRSPRARLRQDGSGDARDAEYWLPALRGYGRAEQVERHKLDEMDLFKAHFTTCDPADPDWRLHSRKTHLDMEKGQGTARDVSAYFMGVPVFYTPYIRFPLDDRRQSGLLLPSAGHSNNRGLEISLPVYWNIAPNYDATFTPRLMTRRGLQLHSEFRYLLPHSEGQTDFSFLPNDRQRDDDNRYFVQWRHETRFTSALRANIQFSEVSDIHYFEDLGTDLEIASTTHLEQRASLFYQGQGYYLLGQAQRFQSLDPNPAANPYERVPQLIFGTAIPERNFKFNPNLRAEFVHFERDNSELSSGPIGNRVDVLATLSYPMRRAAGFIVPRLALRHTRYHLNNGLDDGDAVSISRSLPSVSLDSGLFFERDVNWLGLGFRQTLEPRVFYQYTPYREQDEIPLFDTGEYDFTFAQMFRDNRFSGADRVGDANQVTAALTTRLLRDDIGEESLRLSLGQVFYFADQQVTLPGQVPQEGSQSSLVGEIGARFYQDFSVSQSLHWNADTQRTEQNMFRLRYQPDSQHVVNLSYRFRERTDLEQTDVSAYWPLNERWTVLGRWNHSLNHNKLLETFAGFEYSSCCWALRLIGRRYLKNLEGDYSVGVFMQLELRGLSGFGRNTSTFLSQRIPGFNDEF